MFGRCFQVIKQVQILPRTCIYASRAGYKSQYSLDTIYPNSNLDFSSKPTFKESSATSSDFSGFIPIEELNIKYSRSGGPGGQNVNKVNTKVEVRFHVQSAKWIPDWIKTNLLEKEKHRITKDGHLVMTSEKTRKQFLNQADCLEKIRSLVWDSAKKPYEPTEEELQIYQARKTRARQSILREKRAHSLKKQSRQKPSVHTL